MQRWTSKIPDRDGFWWWKHENLAGVVEIRMVSNDPYVVIEFGNLQPVTAWKDYVWGDSPCIEPAGEKI